MQSMFNTGKHFVHVPLTAPLLTCSFVLTDDIVTSFGMSLDINMRDKKL